MKGWYGDRQQHAMASKGMRSKGIEHRAGYPDFPKYRLDVGEDYTFFDDFNKAYDEFIEVRSLGYDVALQEFDKDEMDYETISSYDPDLDEDDNYWDDAFRIAQEFDIPFYNKRVRELLRLFVQDQINETTLRDRLYQIERGE